MDFNDGRVGEEGGEGRSQDAGASHFFFLPHLVLHRHVLLLVGQLKDQTEGFFFFRLTDPSSTFVSIRHQGNQTAGPVPPVPPVAAVNQRSHCEPSSVASSYRSLVQ